MTGKSTHEHDTLVEALLVGDLFGLVELLGIVLALDAELLVDLDGALAAVVGDFDDFNDLVSRTGGRSSYFVGENHLIGDAELLSELGLVLEVLEGGVIGGGIGGDRGDDTGTLGHRNSEERKGVDTLVARHGRRAELHTWRWEP